MHRVLVVVGLLLFLTAGAVGMRSALRVPTTLVLAPGATDVQITNISAREQTITYRTPERGYAWRSAVERNLLAHGWMVPNWYRPDMPGHSYLHKTRFWFGTVWDQADLWGGPDMARITVRRWFQFPAWVHRLRGISAA